MPFRQCPTSAAPAAIIFARRRNGSATIADALQSHRGSRHGCSATQAQWDAIHTVLSTLVAERERKRVGSSGCGRRHTAFVWPQSA